MDADGYQEWTRELVQYPKDKEMEYLALGLSGEVGEINNKIKKVLRGDKQVNLQFKEDMIQELGDVMFYLARLCDHFGIGLNQCMIENHNKLEGRKARNTIKGSGDKR